MELVYSVSSRAAPFFRSDGFNPRGHCAVSVKNVLAFTAQREPDPPHDVEDGNNLAGGVDWSHSLYVCDLNTPWDAHEVARLGSFSTVLSWSPCATRIACGDVRGNLRIWVQKEGILNEWSEIHNVHYVQEPIATVAWLHNGRKLVTTVEHKSVEQHRTYQDKFQSQGLNPTFTKFGGCHVDGLMFVTATGRVVTVTVPLDLVHSEVISDPCDDYPRNQRLTERLVDWTYLKSGGFLVAMADTSLVHGEQIIIRRIQYRSKRGEGEMLSDIVGKFLLKDKDMSGKITEVRFLGRDDSRSLLVVTTPGSTMPPKLKKLKERRERMKRERELKNTEESMRKVEFNEEQRKLLNELKKVAPFAANQFEQEFLTRVQVKKEIESFNPDEPDQLFVIDLYIPEIPEPPQPGIKTEEGRTRKTSIHPAAYFAKDANRLKQLANRVKKETSFTLAPDGTVVMTNDGDGDEMDVEEEMLLPEEQRLFRIQKLLHLLETKWRFWLEPTVVSKWAAPGRIGVLKAPDSILDRNATHPTGFVLVHVVDKGSLHCLVRDHSGNIAEVKSLSYPPSPVAVSKKISPTKKLRLLPTEIPIVDLSFTATGACAVGIDSRASIVLFRLSPLIDPGGPASISWCSALLEYCLVSGWDWWDVLISLCRPSLAEAVLERVADSFSRQPAGFQNALKFRFQSMKLTLERVLAANSVGSGAIHQARAVACSVLIMLGCVTAHFRSVLRSSDVLSSDKGPADLLSAKLMQTPLVPDINKMCLQVETKHFYVEAATLQSLQQLIQWVVDLCLWLVASFAQYGHRSHTGNRGPAFEILRDGRALCNLRELLVMIRLWGCVRQQCLPIVIKAVDSLDVIAVLYKILTRILLHQSIDATHDENLLEECANLSASVMIPPIHLDLPPKGLIVEPFSLHKMKRSRPPKGLDGRPQADSSESNAERRAVVRDAVRHAYLGKNPEVVRECTRCSAKSAVPTPSSGSSQGPQNDPQGGNKGSSGLNLRLTAAARSWDQRWTSGCFCGGYWVIRRQRGVVSSS